MPRSVGCGSGASTSQCSIPSPIKVFVDGEPAPMGGIAYVATHPAYRRRGYAGELVHAALGGMRERGVHLSMLHPFAH